MAGLPTACVWCRARPIAPEWRPFCSERCKLQDLARWADGSYAVAGDERPELEREEPAGEGDNEK